MCLSFVLSACARLCASTLIVSVYCASTYPPQVCVGAHFGDIDCGYVFRVLIVPGLIMAMLRWYFLTMLTLYHGEFWWMYTVALYILCLSWTTATGSGGRGGRVVHIICILYAHTYLCTYILLVYPCEKGLYPLGSDIRARNENLPCSGGTSSRCCHPVIMSA